MTTLYQVCVEFFKKCVKIRQYVGLQKKIYGEVVNALTQPHRRVRICI